MHRLVVGEYVLDDEHLGSASRGTRRYRAAWLLDPTNDVVASVTTYITSSISRWRSGL